MRLRLAGLAAAALAGCAETAPPPPLPVPRPAVQQEPVAAAASPTARERVLSSGRLTLPDCLELAEERSERLGALLEDVRIAEARKSLARGAALPTLSAQGSHTRQEDTGSSSPFALSDRSETKLVLEQPLFQGFRDLYSYRSAGLLEDAARRTREGALLEVRLAVAEAYARVLSLEGQREAVASSLALSRSRREELAARLEAGLGRRTELLLAEAQVARNEAQRTRLEGDCADARGFLAFLLGIPADVALAPFPRLTPPDLAPEEMATRALGRRQDLQALARREAAAREAVRAASAAHWPSVDLTGNLYGKREGVSEAIDWDLAVSGSLPLFEGGRTRARVREAEAEQRKAELALRERRRQVSQEILEACSAHRTARALLESLEREARAVGETEGLLREEVRLGIAPQIELLTAQDTLLAARVALAAQEIEERLAALRLWTVLGEFPQPQEDSP